MIVNDLKRVRKGKIQKHSTCGQFTVIANNRLWIETFSFAKEGFNKEVRIKIYLLPFDILLAEFYAMKVKIKWEILIILCTNISTL